MISQEQHSSRQYDQELDDLRTRVLQMGGLVTAQVRDAIDAFVTGNVDEMQRVDDEDQRVNGFEVGIDEVSAYIIARRQPAASDLRMLLGISKIVTDLERCGDEAAKIARISRAIHERERGHFPNPQDIRDISSIAGSMLQTSLDTFARLDATAAAGVMLADREIDARFHATLRQLITFMMEDPRTISTSLDIIFIAKALERIGDHAKNMAEQVIYIVRGTDVRHQDPERIGQQVQQAPQ